MSDEQENTEAESTESVKKKSPMLVMIIVAALMVTEGAGVFVFMKMTSPKPVEAAELMGEDEASGDTLVEIQLLGDRFQNMQQGRVWSWEIEIFLKVKTRNKERVEKILEERQAEIRQGIGQIIRKAKHAYLKEPGLETLHRQVIAYVNKVFGTDADGMNRIDQVLIPRCRGVPRDF